MYADDDANNLLMKGNEGEFLNISKGRRRHAVKNIMKKTEIIRFAGQTIQEHVKFCSFELKYLEVTVPNTGDICNYDNDAERYRSTFNS